jgi:lipoprotein-anchoring transpeptidase ErfK/SrfK
MTNLAAPVLCMFSIFAPTAALAITAEEINAATFTEGAFAQGPDPLVAKVQILLDRAHASPGVIDGHPGENVEKAIAAFETMKGLQVDGTMDAEIWAALDAGGAAMTSYTIIEEDLSDLVEKIPEDYSEMAEMEWLGYTSVEEKLAERFHMDMEFLEELNPEADFSAVGTQIMVADPGQPAETKVARIEADKAEAQLRAFDESDKMVAAYPVTVGSDQLPSPSGTHEVTAIAIEPTYSYRPDENFQQGDNEEPLVLPPGPNNPVGLVWIDLSKPTYGIHGTPLPDEIDKTQSHGCVRMTNWDARELAELVAQGTVVEFVGG